MVNYQNDNSKAFQKKKKNKKRIKKFNPPFKKGIVEDINKISKYFISIKDPFVRESLIELIKMIGEKDK